MSDTDLSAADAYLDDHRAEHQADLFALLAHPSVSATGEGVPECTALVERYCEEYGFDEVETLSTPGHPAVVAHAAATTDDAPTLLLYGHYDVQPVDPDAWTTPPFEPTVRPGPDGRDRIYARGAGDNKGQWFAHLCAVRALQATGGLPVNVTLLIEGEEESGSPHLEALVSEHAADLAADLAYVADGPLDPSGRPHVLLGARGILYVELTATGANRDLHSGNYGGPVPNPAWALVDLLASMRDDAGRVTIDGFYDGVRDIEAADRAALDAMPFDADAMRDDLGVRGFEVADEAYLERLLYAPTLTIAGFESGYTGDGTKTILPATARAKIDMRLVADQDPDAVFDAFRAHVDRHASTLVDIDLVRHAAMNPQRTPLDSPLVDPIVDAVADAWGVAPIRKPSLGGSLPTYVFADVLDTPCVVVPYANEDENNHSPDENIAVDCFRNGVRTTARVISALDGVVFQ